MIFLSFLTPHCSSKKVCVGSQFLKSKLVLMKKSKVSNKMLLESHIFYINSKNLRASGNASIKNSLKAFEKVAFLNRPPPKT